MTRLDPRRSFFGLSVSFRLPCVPCERGRFARR